MEDRFWKLVKKTDDCWIWIGRKANNGYGLFLPSKGGRHVVAHKFSYELVNGAVGELLVCHKCDNKPCVRPDHLFKGTQQDNMDDCKRKRRQAFGNRNANSKLTPHVVIEIRASSESLRVLGKRYGVAKQTIRAVKNRATWKHVD